MENDYQKENSLFSGIGLNLNDKNNLADASKWAAFLGILSLIMLGLALLASLSLLTLGSSAFNNIPETSNIPFKFSGALIGGVYAVMILIYLYPVWSLYKFGSLTKTAIRTDNQIMFSEGVLYLKRFFKFIGILTIVIIALYIILLIVVIVGFGTGVMNPAAI